MGSAPELPLLAWQADRLQIWRLLVSDYLVDRLKHRIRDLEDEIDRMKDEVELERRRAIAAEVTLLVTGMAAGFFLGYFLT